MGRAAEATPPIILPGRRHFKSRAPKVGGPRRCRAHHGGEDRQSGCL